MGDETGTGRRGVSVRRVGASAPGKALLCGEYAVLEGAPAIVAAVDRRVEARWSDEDLPMPPEVVATLERARRRCGSVPGSLRIDAARLRRDRVKLGLGSSAAAAVAAAGAVFATNGQALSDPAVVRRVFECAFDGHAVVAPQGSGVDVAASAFGGFLRFLRDEGGIHAEPCGVPSDLVIHLVWTGHAARTSDLVARVRELEKREPRRFSASMDRLKELANEFANAFASADAEQVVRLAAAYAEAMASLGKAAGAPIVEARLDAARGLAARFSGSAKPCGAGGGDVAIAFFTETDAASAFELACRQEGLHPIEVYWGARGVEVI